MTGEPDGSGAPDDLATKLGEVTASRVERLDELDGGQVGSVHRADLADGRTVVAKTADVSLSVEGAMLRYLAAETDLPVPEVHHVDDDLLVLSFVPGDDPVTPAAEHDLAGHVAALHAHTDAPGESATGASGFHFDTLSGPIRQPNPWTDSWVEFFGEFRLRYVADLAREAGTLPASTHERVTAVCADLDSLLVEPAAPSLVHGDLWTENLLVDGDRVAAVVDPAIYVGHPEVDLAYLLWTETVGEPFIDRYRTLRTVEAGFEERRPVYELHPLLEHVLIFGAEFRPPLRERLDRLGY